MKTQGIIFLWFCGRLWYSSPIKKMTRRSNTKSIIASIIAVLVTACFIIILPFAIVATSMLKLLKSMLKRCS